MCTCAFLKCSSNIKNKKEKNNLSELEFNLAQKKNNEAPSENRTHYGLFD